MQCLPCSLWSHVQCARRTAKRSQFSCHVCRAVPSRRKKGFDQTRSLAVRIPRHILPSPPSSALGSTSTVSDPHTHPSISNSHPPPIPPATQSPYASISVQSANPQASPFCLDNPSQCSMSYHSHSPHSPPEGTARSDTIFSPPISISLVPNINTTAYPQPNNPATAPYTMTSSSPKLTQDYSQTGGSSQETRFSSSSPPDACNASYTADPSSLDATLTPSYSSPRLHHPPPLGVTLSTSTSFPQTPRHINAKPPC